MPISLNVTTIYFNSIEIEWKTGGISEVLYYIVKYRPQPNSYLFDSLTKDMRNFNAKSGSLSIDVDEENFKSLNTTSTKLKVGTSLKPNTFYEFKVVAGNLLGLGDETDILLVKTAATSENFLNINN